MNTKIGFKALRIKGDKEEDEKYGLLDSGATHCVREVQDQEEYHSLIPRKVKVAFESKVETRLFMTRHGTIVGPKGTETIVSVNDLAKTGWKVVWVGDRQSRNNQRANQTSSNHTRQHPSSTIEDVSPTH